MGLAAFDSTHLTFKARDWGIQDRASALRILQSRGEDKVNIIQHTKGAMRLNINGSSTCQTKIQKTDKIKRW